ncbi:hypothetical protein GUK30_36670 [Rhizobium leguminosarum]|uniref:Uncharacterized protein n=1 Tax=Rhizobium ruizarguesonis TaxID=2081791 RepID=A0AAE4YXI6_9HYPH|nr:hypothetical protein [Rhizobium ruizarguesonis]NEH35643.1 hypothetical protein [Rhizobium ruizarguesonis]NEH67493.1 hypothetical protein [Rhizobium ruizarguesonis]NEI24855.1 hypothetical protein [Rhizobium ruizarguesonis]NEI31971.1 hypothetical protein [Rhizobium ruizarguesonis]
MHCNSALAETAASTYPGLTACDGHEVLVKFRPKPQRPEMPRHEWVNPSTKVG